MNTLRDIFESDSFKEFGAEKLIENQIKFLATSQRQSYNPQDNDIMTDLTCVCGGFLVQRPRHSDNDIMASAERVIGEIPKHKKTRIQKKWRKRWAEKAGPIILGLKLAAIMGPPTFICSKCGKQEGFYGAIGRNIIKVEPLSEGAAPVYYMDEGALDAMDKAEDDCEKKIEEARQEERDDWQYSRE